MNISIWRREKCFVEIRHLDPQLGALLPPFRCCSGPLLSSFLVRVLKCMMWGGVHSHGLGGVLAQALHSVVFFFLEIDCLAMRGGMVINVDNRWDVRLHDPQHCVCV